MQKNFLSLQDFNGERLNKAIFSETKDTIKKGRVSDFLRWGGDNITFRKKGSEIKEKLKSLKDKNEAVITTFQSRLNELKKDFDETDFLDSMPYECEENEVECQNKMIDWKIIWNEVEIGTGSPIPSPTEKQTKAREYNDLLQKICSLKADNIAAEKLINVFDDNETYELTPRQLTIFGF